MCADSWQVPHKSSDSKRKPSSGNRQSDVIEILNRQRRHRINRKQWQEFTQQALQAIGKSSSAATVVFVGDQTIKKLNRRFRGKNQATDVLSFPVAAEVFENENKESLGEVVISLQRAAEQAKHNRFGFHREVKQLILHGLLHLSGYDHETDSGEMNRLEVKLRHRLGI
jgi:probable rRNA maturation factor